MRVKYEGLQAIGYDYTKHSNSITLQDTFFLSDAQRIIPISTSLATFGSYDVMPCNLLNYNGIINLRSCSVD